MNFNKPPEHKTPENFSPAPDRNKLIETIKSSGLESEDAKALYGKYFEHLCENAEKVTGEGNVKVGVEMAKICHDAGLVEEAFNTLVNGEESLAYAARNLGLHDLYNEINRLADEWEAE